MMVGTAAGRMRVASCSKLRGASSLWGLHLLLCACLGRERGVFLPLRRWREILGRERGVFLPAV